MSVAVIDLFAGAGGFSLGAHRLTDEVVGIELARDAVATQDCAGMTCEMADITSLDPVVHDPRNEVPETHLHLHASPPCQTFSAAGKGAGRTHIEVLSQAAYEILTYGFTGVDLSDVPEGSLLVLEPARWVWEIRPDSISLEQVRSVLPLWEAYAVGLEGLGYDAWAALLHSEQYGVPQTRTRAWLGASLHRPVEAPAPTHSRYHVRDPLRLDEGVLPWVSMAEALGKARSWSHYAPAGVSQKSHPASPRKLDEAPAPTVTAVGNHYFFNPEVDTFGENLTWEHQRPSTTVCGDPRLSGPGRNDPTVSGSQYGANARKITIEEAGVLQGFPADYPWQGTKTSQFRQAGNAVCPAVAEAVLRSVL